MTAVLLACPECRSLSDCLPVVLLLCECVVSCCIGLIHNRACHVRIKPITFAMLSFE